jgi:putative N-acetylmannosamine-6-phosphate epimerase
LVFFKSTKNGKKYQTQIDTIIKTIKQKENINMTELTEFEAIALLIDAGYEVINPTTMAIENAKALLTTKGYSIIQKVTEPTALSNTEKYLGRV